MDLDIEEYINSTVVKNDAGEVKNLASLPVSEIVSYLIENVPFLLLSKKSKRWRMENLYQIVTKAQTKEVFKFNEAQADLFDKYLERGYKKVIMLKSRQLGMTTFMSIWILDEVLFNPNSAGMQVAHKKEDVVDIFQSKIGLAIDNIPEALWGIVSMVQNKSNRITFEYPDEGTGKSQSIIGVGLSARSKTLNFLHVSELAKLGKTAPARALELQTGTFQAVSKQSKNLIVIESTAEGAYGLFYDMYMSSFKRKKDITPLHTISEYYPVFYNWTWDKRDIEETLKQIGKVIPTTEMEQCEIDWAEYQRDYNLSDKEITYYYFKWIEAGRDVNKLNQEYPTTEMEAFIATGSNFFSSKKMFKELEKIEASNEPYQTYVFENGIFIKEDIKYSERFEGLIVYEEPEDGRNYIIGGDVAEGIESGDYSTAVVLGLDKKPKAVYRGHIEPQDFERLVFALGIRYNKALLAVEYNKDGNWVNAELYKNSYPNIYFRTAFDDINKVTTKFYGWRTDSKTRPIALNEFKRFFNNCDNFPFRIILDEMLNFVRDKKGKPQAQLGKHDDIVMAAAIAYAILIDRQERNQGVVEKQNSYFKHIFI